MNNVGRKTFSLFLTIDEFLAAANKKIIIDLRAEHQYLEHHIPDALNIPLQIDTAFLQEPSLLLKRQVRYDDIKAAFLNISTFEDKLAATLWPGAIPYFYCKTGAWPSKLLQLLLEQQQQRACFLEGGFQAFCKNKNYYSRLPSFIWY